MKTCGRLVFQAPGVVAAATVGTPFFPTRTGNKPSGGCWSVHPVVMALRRPFRSMNTGPYTSSLTAVCSPNQNA